MYLLIVSLIFNLFVINSALTDRGEFDWKKLGTTIKSRIAGGNGGVTVTTSSVKLLQQYQPRVNLMSSTSSYYRLPDVRGNTIRVTVDLSQTTCSCNAALYLIQLPSGASPDAYCDAQGAPGQSCVEIDMIEANTKAFQATAHTGDASNYGKWGFAWNIKSAQGYGPGGSGIDTTKPYTVDFSFTKSSSGTLNGMKVHLTQSGKSGLSTTISDSTCNWMTSNYISGLDSAMKSGQLVLVASYWSGDMNWLDGCSSGGSTCPSGSTVTFSNLQLISGVTSILADETSNDNNLPFVQSPVFIGIMCAVGLLLLVAVIAFILIKRKNALNQEIV
jgi:hypothetical protein